MSGSSERNALRVKAVLNARRYKDLFARAFVPRRWIYNWLFRGENGELRRVGEHVLADLRSYADLNPNQFEGFQSDHAAMAYRAGKQAVVRRIFYYLNLDEETVQKLMELDDGI